MLIPRFSIRWLLGLTTFSAGVSLVLSYAVKGQAWAVGVIAGLWALVTTFLFFAAAFLVAWFITGGNSGFSRRVRSMTDVPAADQPPSPPLASSSSIDLPPPITG
jgi:hypothetical protein